MSTQTISTQTARVITFPTPSVDAQLEAKIARYLELKALNSEYNRLQKELKGLFENTPHMEVGKYTVTGSIVSRDGYAVQAYSYWDMKISAK